MKITEHKKTFIKKHWYRPLFNKGDFLFVHGFNSTWYVHAAFLEKMYNAGYNLFTFDLPNHGVNFDYNVQLTFDDYCIFVKDFIKKNKLKKVIIAGHSMGGGIVAALQDDNSLKFKNIILIDPLQEGATTNKAKRVFSSILTNGFTKLTEWFDKKNSNPSLEHLNLLKDINSDETMAKIKSGMENINQPVELIFGEQDDIIPVEPSLEIIKASIKYLDVSIIKNAKHSPTVQNTDDTFTEIIKFLKKN